MSRISLIKWQGATVGARTIFCILYYDTHSQAKSNCLHDGYNDICVNNPIFLSIGSTSPSRFRQQQCWVPVVANHFPATSPFSAYPQAVITTTAATAVATVVTAATTSAAQQFTVSPPVALVPVIVPVLAPPPAQINTRPRSIRRSGGREVKFETPVWRQLSDGGDDDVCKEIIPYASSNSVQTDAELLTFPRVI
jgi:hypothetical protein